MQKTKSPAPASSFGVHDVLFVLFKHKWLIAVLSILGFGAAAVVFVTRVPSYQSTSKLLVRYVLDRGTADSYQNESSPGGKPGDSVINTEIEILTSVDLAAEVAEKIGVSKILPDAGPGATVSDAAGKILSDLHVVTGQSSNVLLVTYGSENPELSKTVLRELVDRYFDKHLAIHRSVAAFDAIAKQTEDVHKKLMATEAELNKLRTDTGILSLADATGALSSQRAKAQEDLMAAKAESAELKAKIESLEKTSLDSAKSAEQEHKGDKKDSLAKERKETPPPQVITEYRTVTELLSFLQKRDVELRIKFKSGSRLLETNQEQINTYDGKRRALIEKFPNLVEEAQVVEKDSHNPDSSLVVEKSRLAAANAKIEVFETYLKEISEQFSKQYVIGAQIEEVDRRKQMEDEEYRTLEAKLKNARIDQTLDPSRMPNIEVIQQPTEPIKSYDDKTKKLILGLAGGGLAIGLGLAFLIELLLDRRVKRPIEIQARLQLPLLLSIPFIQRKDRGRLLLDQDPAVPKLGGGRSDNLITASSNSGDVGVKPNSKRLEHFILPYSETIRDRIIFNFELNNLTHKPKLVAVTGLSEGAGASTIAAGLAKSFSEIPGMKVLLVDLSSCHPEENPLFGEIPRHSLNGALHLAEKSEFREGSQALYYASATARRDEGGLSTFSPVHLYELMPQLQGSDYDYIVFDMPPVDQTSRTLTMAGLMDKVLLVLDAENTSRDGLMWGYSELQKGKADVSCIFNKTRSHVPGWLLGEN